MTIIRATSLGGATLSADKVLLTPSGTDDTARIQAAIDGLATTSMPDMKFINSSGIWQGGTTAPGGGRVVLGPGEWKWSNLVLGHRVALEGVGTGTVGFQLSGSTGPMITNRRDGSVHAKYCRVANLTLHGNKAGQTVANRGIYWLGDTASDFTNPLDEDYDEVHVIHNVYVFNCKGDGFRCEGSSANRVSNSKFHHCDGYGMRLSQDTHVTHVDVGWSGLAGVFVDGGSTVMDNVKAWYSGVVTSAEGCGFRIATDSAAFSTLIAQDNNAQGFLFDGANTITANGLLADSNSKIGAGSYFGIDIYNSNWLQITGVCRNRFNAAGPQTKGLQSAGGSTNNDIDVLAAASPWGTTTPWSGTAGTGSRVIVNGTTR